MVDLIDATWTLAATCCAFDAGVMDFLDRPRHPEEVRAHASHLPAALVDALVDVLAVTGRVTRTGSTVRLSDPGAPLVRSPHRAAIVAEMKSALLQAHRLLSATPPGPEPEPFHPWQHRDTEVLELQGAGGALMAELLSTTLVDSMPGLRTALRARGAAFLDVGAGVASISIAMAERWPSMCVVGLEPWMPSVRLACRNVRAAGVSDRVEIRAQRVETMCDRDSFDLAWVPTPFIAEEVLPDALARVRDSLRAGGWIVAGITGAGVDDGDAALTRLVTATWGGSVLAPERAAALLVDAGFSHVRAVSLPAGPTALVARRGVAPRCRPAAGGLRGDRRQPLVTCR